MSKGGGGGGTTQTIQKADPWIGLQGPLSTLYEQAQAQYNAPGPAYYPSSTVAPQSGTTQTAQALLEQRATGGNPLIPQAQQQLYDTLGDQYFGLNPALSGLMGMAGGAVDPSMAQLTSIGSGAMLNANPYVDAMFNKAAGRVGEQFSNNVMPGIASMFSQAGRYGSNAMQETTSQAQQNYGDTISNLANQIYGGNYANERGLQQQALGQMGSQFLGQRAQQLGALGEIGTGFGRERALQLSALGMAPQLAGADYGDINQLGQLGSQRDAYGQSLLNADIARWDYGQNLTAQKLQQLNALLQGGSAYSGLSSTSTAPQAESNPLMGAVGGAMAGYQLGGMASGALGGASLGPWGALAGAVLGGLFS